MFCARSWPDIHVAALRQRFGRGMSFAQIAADINATFGTSYSRNGCIGKARRLGLKSDKPKARRLGLKSDRPKPPRREKRELVIQVRKPSPRPEEVVLRCANIIPHHLSIYELTAHTCRWPYGGWPESKVITFCGCEPIGGSPYCETHLSLSQGPGTISERAAHRVSTAA